MSLAVFMVSRCLSLELVLDKACKNFLWFQSHCSENEVPRYGLSDNDAAMSKCLITYFSVQKIKKKESVKLANV